MKLLFFSPFSVIWQHAFPEAVVAHSLQDFGHEIVYVTCSRLYNKQCIGMPIYGIDVRSSEAERKKICQICGERKKVLSQYLKLQPVEIMDFISESEKNTIDQRLEKLSRQEWIELVEEDLAVGKIAFYIVLLKYKKLSESFTEEEWREYFIELQYVLYTLKGIKKIIQAENPDAVFIYNSFYPVNRVVALMAEKLKVKVYWTHAGGILANRLQTLNIGQGHHYDILNKILSHWHRQFKNIPALPSDIYRVRDHFFELIQGNNIFVYSRPNNPELDIPKYYGITENQKIIVAVQSSHDERIGVETIGVLPKQQGLIFDNQIVWLKALIEYVKNNNDIYLIIRVHPREFPNRRESILSDYAKTLQTLFSDLPNNVKINWPSDNISMYQLAKFMDVCLHAGSSVGKEMALLGIPVVNYMRTGLSYPFDLSIFAENQTVYFESITDALQKGWSIEYARKAYRWCAFEFVTAVFDLSDKCKLKENHVPSLLKRIIRKIATKLDPFILEKWDCKYAMSSPRVALQIHKLLESNAISKIDLMLEDELTNRNYQTETASIQKVHQEILSLLYSKDEKYGTRVTLREKSVC